MKVAGSSVNGFDLSVASGRLEGMMAHRFPLVLGMDFAGTVEVVGEGVEGFAPGDTVLGVAMKPFLGGGAPAEYVTVSTGFGVARIPAGLDVKDAAALGLAGTAALNSVEAAAGRSRVRMLRRPSLRSMVTRLPAQPSGRGQQRRTN